MSTKSTKQKGKTLTPYVVKRLTTQLARQLGIAWAIVNPVSLRLVRVYRSRAEARTNKQPNERVVRVDLTIKGLRA